MEKVKKVITLRKIDKSNLDVEVTIYFITNSDKTSIFYKRPSLATAFPKQNIIVIKKDHPLFNENIETKIIAHEFSHILYTNHMDYFLRFDSKDTMWFNVNEMCACALEFFDDIYLSLLELNKQESDDDIALLLKGEICNS